MFSPIKLDHLRTLTDDRGILEHAKFSVPDRRKGYTTDDNARALIAILKYYKLYEDISVLDLIRKYTIFLLQMQDSDGRIHNRMNNNLYICDDDVDDSQGRTLWACGEVMTSNLEAGIKRSTKEIFDKGLRWSLDSSSPRIIGYTIVGLHNYCNAYPSDVNVVSNMRILAEQLISNYETHSSSEWKWFEPYLTYANAILSNALFLAYESTGEKMFLNVAKETLDFLVEIQIMDGVFVPIGNRDWYRKDGNRAFYDQQPIEAAHMIMAASSALKITHNQQHYHTAKTVFDWFFGKNLKEVVLYDPVTGGCFDGISPKGINQNQGAESTISYLLARTEMERMRKMMDQQNIQ